MQKQTTVNSVIRIYTEEKNLAAIHSLMSEHRVDGTLYFAEGRFKGGVEDSLIIEVILPELCPCVPESIITFASQIGAINQQKEVWLTHESVAVTKIIYY